MPRFWWLTTQNRRTHYTEWGTRTMHRVASKVRRNIQGGMRVPKIAKILLITVVVLAVMVPAGTYAYIHFVENDAPDRLTFETTTTLTGTPQGSTTTVTTTPQSLDGVWNATSSSQVGYR